MKTPFMQWVDGHVGPPVCWVRSLCFRKEKAPPGDVKKVLIIKMFGLGSMILMTPMIRSIRKSHPGAKIYFMTLAGNLDLIMCYKMSDEALTVRRNNFVHFLMDSIRNIRFIRKESIDVVIDAEFFSRYTALFSSFCRRSYLVGFFNRNMYRGKFLDKRCYFNQYYHMKRNFMELANAFCRPSEDGTVNIPTVSDDAKARAEKLLKDNGISRPFIILNPNTSDITPSIDRSWPIENFASMGRFLGDKGYKIVVIGDRKQQGRARDLASMCPGSVSFAGRTNIEELIALIGRSFCVITNDSAPLHIAASQDVPTMAFFGTDIPTLYGYTEQVHSTFFKAFPCSPCLSVFNYKRGECEFDSRCVRTIDYKEVADAFEKKEAFLKEAYEKRKAL